MSEDIKGDWMRLEEIGGDWRRLEEIEGYWRDRDWLRILKEIG